MSYTASPSTPGPSHLPKSPPPNIFTSGLLLAEWTLALSLEEPDKGTSAKGTEVSLEQKGDTVLRKRVSSWILAQTRKLVLIMWKGGWLRLEIRIFIGFRYISKGVLQVLQPGGRGSSPVIQESSIPFLVSMCILC